jgi:type III secretion system YscI/HrpB-like protein
MDVVRPDLAAAAAKPIAGEGPGAAATPGGKSFDDVLAHVDGSKIKVHSPEAVVPSLQVDASARAEALRADQLKVAKTEGGVEQLSLNLERSTSRLREIVGQLQSGETFSPQELLGMQAEMNDITLQIEVTTKVVAETVAGVRHLMQQQA